MTTPIEPAALKAALRELLSQPVKVTADEMAEKLYPQGYVEFPNGDRRAVSKQAMQWHADNENRKLEKFRRQFLETLDHL